MRRIIDTGRVRPRVHYDGAVPPSAIRALGLAGSFIYAAFIVWLYATGPATMAEVTGGVAAGFHAYRADESSFQEGLRLFHADNFEAARTAFDRADPAKRDSRVQFYVAYSYYRQGWGRLWNDDALFRKGLEALDRAVAADASGRVAVEDDTLGMRSSDELRAELQEGIRRDASDFNPMRVMRKRK
jgi:tetratricopeptide (TPR) repeat protein